MTNFPFLFRIAILDIGWLLPTTGACVLVSYLVLRLIPAARPASYADWFSPLLPFVVPTLMLFWAGVSYGAEKEMPPGKGSWRSAALIAATIPHLVLLGWLARRQRRWIYPLLALGLLSLVWLALALFVGSMAIADDWI